MSWLSDWFLSRSSARAAAVAEGLEVRTTHREFLLSKDRGRTYSMQPIKCVEYRLRHRAPTNLHWRFLMRHDANDVAPGCRLEEGGGVTPDSVRSALGAIAADPSVEMGWELFEFEGDASGVSVYWAEWGGAKMTRQLILHLRQLSRAMQES